MLKLLFDEHIDRALVRGLLAREPGLDLVRVQQVGLRGADDRDILSWAAIDQRLLVTLDRNTMAGFAHERVRAGEPMPGVFVLDNQLSMGRAIDELLVLAVCSKDDEWRDQVVYVPIRASS